MQGILRVSRKGATIPGDVLEAIGVKEGDVLLLRVEEGRIVVEKVEPLKALRGILAERTEKGVAEELDVERKRSDRP